jgi:hypothetical protein
LRIEFPDDPVMKRPSPLLFPMGRMANESLLFEILELSESNHDRSTPVNGGLPNVADMARRLFQLVHCLVDSCETSSDLEVLCPISQSDNSPH